jgi:hypothetical protein
MPNVTALDPPRFQRRKFSQEMPWLYGTICKLLLENIWRGAGVDLG